jgi:hypothetical protein
MNSRLTLQCSVLELTPNPKNWRLRAVRAHTAPAPGGARESSGAFRRIDAPAAPAPGWAACGQGEAGGRASGRLQPQLRRLLTIQCSVLNSRGERRQAPAPPGGLQPQLRRLQAGRGEASACGQGEAEGRASGRLQPQLRRLQAGQHAGRARQGAAPPDGSSPSCAGSRLGEGKLPRAGRARQGGAPPDDSSPSCAGSRLGGMRAGRGRGPRLRTAPAPAATPPNHTV